MSNSNNSKLLSLSEIALVCSHRNVISKIANDNNIKDDDWSLIMGCYYHSKY